MMELLSHMFLEIVIPGKNWWFTCFVICLFRSWTRDKSDDALGLYYALWRCGSPVKSGDMRPLWHAQNVQRKLCFEIVILGQMWWFTCLGWCFLRLWSRVKIDDLFALSLASWHLDVLLNLMMHLAGIMRLWDAGPRSNLMIYLPRGVPKMSNQNCVLKL